ncbi:MAG: DUF5658 family protein [Halolamina sp.]
MSEYWEWVAVALFLLVTLDLLTTLYAAAEVGRGAESNPLMRWLIGRSLATLIGVNVAAATVVCGLFRGLMAAYRATPAPYRRYFGYLIELWLGLLVAAGLVVFANNTAVIVLGESILVVGP